ncbi:MAG TPA: hypothetical protein VIP57_14385 [Candidatus Dormibacteraeota bacterium]
MKSNRKLLIAGVIAAIALVVPALALAAEWKDKNGTKITKLTEFTLNGGEIFETTPGNGMDCEIHAKMTTSGGSTASITEFKVKKCEGSFGTFKTTKCELNVGEGKSLPWTVDVNTEDLTVTNWRIKHTFKGAECKEPELDKTITSMTVKLEPNIKEMSVLAFDGKITNEKSEQTFRTAGSPEVEGTNNGTYGIQ